MIKVIHNDQELYFNTDNHSYTVDNKNYISVTTIISKFFPKFDLKRNSLIYALNHNKNQNDVIKQWKQEGEEAAIFGSIVHKYIECILLKKKTIKPQTDKEKIYFGYIDIWIDKFLKYFDIIDIEKIIFAPKYKIAGTFDCIARCKKTGRYIIIDWKTSKKIEIENKWQNCINGLEEFSASDYTKFTFQLNMYLRLLKNEKYYSFDKKPELKIIHITKEGLKSISIPILNKRVIDILFKCS